MANLFRQLAIRVTGKDFDAAGRAHSMSDKLPLVVTCRLDRQTEVCRTYTEIWLGRKDSNLRMPDPKTGALPLGDAPTYRPTSAAKQQCADFSRWAHLAAIGAAPDRSTGKDAPTSFEFDRLNGASLRILAVKTSKHRRTAARE